MSLLDKLPKILSFSKKNDSHEFYFALNIGDEKLEASVWGIEKKRLQVLNTSISNYTQDDDLTKAANLALDEALADFFPEPAKILFGVPDSWLQDDDLKPEHLKMLRGLVKELDVVPMAYVSITHAIAHLLQKLEGVPTTAILIEINDPLIVTIVKSGKVIGNKVQRRSANLPEDIEKVLLAFTDVEVLPSKILIYGSPSGGLNKFKQELLAYSWMSQLPFLHLPRVDALDDGIGIKAISFAGASEIIPEIHLHPADLHIKSEETTHKMTHQMPLESKIRPEHANIHRPKVTDFDDGGFIAGDIEEKEQQMDSFEEENLPVERHPLQKRAQLPVSFEDEYPAPSHHTGGKSLSNSVASVISAPGRFLNLRVLLIPVLLIGLLASAVIFLPKATVTVFVDPKTLENDATVTADPGVTVVDEANKKIPGKSVDTEVTGSAKGTASGKKKVGDPARGTVVVYNKTDGPKNLSAGTQLVGPGNLIFTLDSSVQVASSSAVEGGISFGKTSANVTASVIGPDGNLPAGKDLSIKGQADSDLAAKVDTAFSGGVSKDVTVVTSDDQKKLLAQLSTDLKKQAADQIQGKLDAGTQIMPEGLSEKIVKQTFSKNVNDQAQEFSLNLVADYKGVAYSDADLKAIVSKLVETNVPDNYYLDLTKTETQADISKIDSDGRLIFTAKFKAKLMPKLDTDKIRKQITFKSPSQVDTILKTYENVIGEEIKFSPSLPAQIARLPILAKNITVTVTSK